MAGFKFRKSLKTADEPVLLYFTVKNSQVITLGDAVKINTDGFAEISGATSKVAGIVQQVVSATGTAIDADTGTNDTYTMDSDNQTVAGVQVGIITSKDVLFYNDSDDTLATTNLLQFFDLVAASDQIDVGTASDTGGLFQLISLDPDGDGDASKGLFRIAESQLDPYAAQ